jgi:cytochrome c oxidase cbb3-type subunit 2
METASKWTPGNEEAGFDGKRLFSNHCASCHGANGVGNGPISLELARKPTNLVAGPFVWTAAGEGLDLRVARVIKFGIIGTDMPGHEVLADGQVVALKDYVLKLREKR